jgi:hypothetical protein
MSNYWEVFDVVNDLIKSLANANKKHCTFYVDKFAAIPLDQNIQIILPLVYCISVRPDFIVHTINPVTRNQPSIVTKLKDGEEIKHHQSFQFVPSAKKERWMKIL